MIETFLDVPATWATFASGEYATEVDGVLTWKLEDDLDRYRRIIEAAQPEVIVETGTAFGGSAIWFSQFAEVITIDADGERARPVRPGYPHIHWLIGDSLDPAVHAAVVDLIDGRSTMVVLDSEHAAPHVLREIQDYGKLVTPGQYLVVEDGIFDLVDPSLAHLGGARIPLERGPLRAIELTVAEDTHLWERDTAIEQLTDRTYHAGGFWMRTACTCGPRMSLPDVADGQEFVQMDPRCPEHMPSDEALAEVEIEIVRGAPGEGVLDLAAGSPEPVAEPVTPKKRAPRKKATAPETTA